MTVGMITDFRGSWGSGLAILEIGGCGILCENGATVRALAAIFGDEVIGPGHTVNVAYLRGRIVEYETDGMGLLASLSPA